MFKPPISLVNKIKENQNMKTVEYETQQAANNMYKRDPVIKHNLENFQNYDSRTSGLVSNKDTEQLWEQPFEPIVGHTGVNMFPEVEANMFQRKFEAFTGQDKVKFFSQKEAVTNDPYLMAPEPILNSAVPNPQDRIDFLKQGLLRQGNIKPFESELVGARHIQPIFRPLPKVGADRTVNPKKTLEYQTTTPPVSNIPKGTLASQTFKNKVERAFAMDRLGFTTTGAVVKQSQYGTVDNKYQNRPETAPTKEQIFRNANTETPLQQKSPDNFLVNTQKESTQLPHVGQAAPFNQTSLYMKSAENYNVNTAKEGLQHEYIGNTSPFNQQELYMKGADNYHVNTAKEGLQHEYIGNTSPFNQQELYMKGADNYHVNTAKEGLQHQYIGNTSPFNQQALHMKGADNYHVNTEKEDVMQINHTGNAAPFNDVEAQASSIGEVHFISKDDILRGRKPTMCGPSITNVDVNVGFNKRHQLYGVREFTNGGTSTTERLTSAYKMRNSEIDLTERLDPCLNIPMLDNPYANYLI